MLHFWVAWHTAKQEGRRAFRRVAPSMLCCGWKRLLIMFAVILCFSKSCCSNTEVHSHTRIEIQWTRKKTEPLKECKPRFEKICFLISITILSLVPLFTCWRSSGLLFDPLLMMALYFILQFRICRYYGWKAAAVSWYLIHFHRLTANMQ